MDAVEQIAEAVPGLVSAMNIARIEFDGSCEPKNPGGIATGGYRVLIGDTLVHERGEFYMKGDGATNNVAEYYALGRALAQFVNCIDYPKKLAVVNLQIVGDSQLVVKQIDGEWKCKTPHLEQLRDRCRELIGKINAEGIKVTLAWIPRERNEAADLLSQKAYEEHTGKKYPTRHPAAAGQQSSEGSREISVSLDTKVDASSGDELQKGLAAGEMAYAAASDDWKTAAIEAVEYVCRANETFITDQVWDRLKETDAPECHEKRAMSGVLREAESRGWCELTASLSRSAQQGCHGNLVSVRISKLYQKQVATDS